MTYKLTPDQQRRGQLNGAPKPRNPQSTMRKIILDAITRQPMGSGQLTKSLNFGEHHVNTVLKLLSDDGKIIVIGTAEQAGIKAFRKDTKIWAIPGTPELPPVKPVSVTERIRNPAPTWYRGEFTPLVRDPYALAKLAMATRK